MRTKIILLTAAALAATGWSVAQNTASGRTATPSQPRPLAPPRALPPSGDFVRTIDNRWFPLKPGTVLTYKGQDEGTPAKDVLRVTHRTKLVEGIRTTVIDDRVYKDGRLAERTHDYYAQDKKGNVWYLGEDTATYKRNGQIDSREGTFHAGVDGARGGIFMPAHPRPGVEGWQEYYIGHAQDRFKILNLHTKVHTPAVASRHAMLVQETTPIEPGVVDHKVYVRGIGTVREDTVKGGHESFELVSVRHR